MSSAEKMRELTLEDVAKVYGNGQQGSDLRGRAEAEFLRRQTQAQLEASKYMKRNSRYMLWSVLALFVAAAIDAAIGLVDYLAS